MNDNTQGPTGACPHCHLAGRHVNFICPDDHLRRHADPESSGAYAVCDEHKVYWHVSGQFWNFAHLESKEAVRHNTRIIKSEYTQVEPYCPTIEHDGANLSPPVNDNTPRQYQLGERVLFNELGDGKFVVVQVIAVTQWLNGSGTAAPIVEYTVDLDDGWADRALPSELRPLGDAP